MAWVAATTTDALDPQVSSHTMRDADGLEVGPTHMQNSFVAADTTVQDGSRTMKDADGLEVGPTHMQNYFTALSISGSASVTTGTPLS